MNATNSSSTTNTGLGTGFGAFPGMQNFIGPPLLAAFLQALETGVIINQAITFFGHTAINRAHSSSYRNSHPDSENLPVTRRSSSTVRIGERAVMKLAALLALLLSMVQTASSFYGSWLALVVNFGDWVQAIAVHWPLKLQPIVVVFLAAPVQSFLIWRCWLLTNRNNYIVTFLLLLMLSSVVISIVLSTNLLMLDFSTFFTPEMAAEGIVPAAPPIDPLFVASLAIPSFLDICLTGILLSFLLRSRAVVVSRRFRKTLQSIIAITWEAALPPCLCAIITLITYLTLRSTFWDLLFQGVLGQLYIISLFVTLNGFNDLKNRDRDMDPTTALGYSWSDSSNKIRHRSRIPNDQRTALTMSINILSSSASSLPPRRTTSSSQPRSPRLQLSLPPTHAHHVIDIPEMGDAGVSPTVRTPTTNTVSDCAYEKHEKVEDIFESREGFQKGF